MLILTPILNLLVNYHRYMLDITLIINFIVFYHCYIMLYHQATPIRISLVTSSSRRISSAKRSHRTTANITYAKCELD